MMLLLRSRFEPCAPPMTAQFVVTVAAHIEAGQIVVEVVSVQPL
jgi:hypothetical protein